MWNLLVATDFRLASKIKIRHKVSLSVNVEDGIGLSTIKTFLIFMEPCIVVWLVAITNKMQLSCILLVIATSHTTMHGSMHIKFINAKQATEIHAYKNIKRKLYKTNAAVWFNKTWRVKQLTPNYINIKINGNNRQCKLSFILLVIATNQNILPYSPPLMSLTIY